MNVPVNDPVITDEAKKNVYEALESGWISSAGPFIGKFEEDFARFIGVKHAVTASSGTSALHLCLAALGIGPGDEVIVPAFTMIASVDAVLYVGAKPVFIDSDPETYNMDVAQLPGKITGKTKAIMPVHIYGHSVDMDPVLAIARKHGLAVIEDAAEAHGATYKGRLCGSMGTINAFSFYANKIVTTGEGGMVTTNDDRLAERVRTLKDLAHAPKRRFWHEEMGFNYRMTNLQAAVGLGQLHSIGKFLKTKQRMAEGYAKGLAGIKGLRLPVTKDYAKNVYWMYGVLVEDVFGMSRDALRAALKKEGVDTRDFFYATPSMPLVRAHIDPAERFPVAEDLERRGFYLPSGLAITDEQIRYVCDAVRKIAQG
jgi:perosamine synthetase